MQNLDYLTADYGMQIIVDPQHGETTKDIAKAIEGALSILQHDGLFALWLWLHEANKAGRYTVGHHLNRLVHDDSFPVQVDDGSFFAPDNDYVATEALERVRTSLTQDLKLMYFVRDILKRTLTYARHRAKVASPPVGGSLE